MATQQTGRPPNIKRLGIFPDSIRKFVIVCMIILFLIGGIIGIIGAWQNWGIVSNVLFMIFAVASVILGILTFWPPPQPTPVQVDINNNIGQPANQKHMPTSITNNANHNEPGSQNTILNTSAANIQHQSSTNAPGVNTPVSPTPEQRDELSQLDKDDLYNALTKCLPAVFTKVVRYSHVPTDILSGEEKPQAIRADELIRWAESQGNQGLLKLHDAMQKAEVEVPHQYSEPRARVIEEVREKEPESQSAPEQKRIAGKLASDKAFPNTRRGCVDEAQSYVNQAYYLLDPEMNILPEDIANAAQYLETAKRNIEHLEELLQENPPHSEHGRIIDQLRIIIDQINKFIIPQLKTSVSVDKNFQKRFVPLLNALNRLDTLIPG
jgi:hypothetical protein